jgi:hypothetical protein
MMAYYFERDTPEMRAPVCRIVRINRSDEAAQHGFAADEHDAAEQSDEQCEADRRANHRGAHASLPPFRFVQILFAARCTCADARYASEKTDQCEKTDDAAARIRQNQRDAHNDHRENVKWALVAFRRAGKKSRPSGSASVISMYPAK